MITFRNSAPTTAPTNEPRPPSRLAPPSTAAAMLVSVKLKPALGSPIWTWASEEQAAERGGEGGDEEGPDEQVGDAHAAAGGGFLVETHRACRQAARASGTARRRRATAITTSDDQRHRHETDAVEHACRPARS